MNRVAGILVKCKNEVLLCRRGPKESFPGFWGIPSGHVNKKEDIKNAAYREFHEETNIEISEKIKLIGIIPLGKVLFYVYYLKVNKKIYPDLENALDGNEHDMCGWFKFYELPKKINENLKNIIKLAFNL